MHFFAASTREQEIVCGCQEPLCVRVGLIGWLGTMSECGFWKANFHSFFFFFFFPTALQGQELLRIWPGLWLEDFPARGFHLWSQARGGRWGVLSWLAFAVHKLSNRPTSLLDVMNGYNGTVFAYGQTGSGKTFTMQVWNLFHCLSRWKAYFHLIK